MSGKNTDAILDALASGPKLRSELVEELEHRMRADVLYADCAAAEVGV